MAKNGNRALGEAKKQKKDEFYTQLADINAELRHYSAHFAGKVVFCNCDDPYESNFFKYFAANFNALKLKRLIATCYAGSPVAGRQLELDLFGDGRARPLDAPQRIPHKIVINEVTDVNGDGRIDLADVEWLIKNDKNVLTRLDGDGDFRSSECVELLEQSDVVVTNPPFSLFREYVAQLVQYGKKFLIIGRQDAVTYKEIFPLIKAGKMWLGYGFPKGNAYFAIPKGNVRDFANGVYDGETGLVKFRNCTWFTNLDHKRRHEEYVAVRKYNPTDYPRLDNFDAIFVEETVVRPKYQREFIYSDVEQKAVIDTVTKGYPLNVMYWAVRGDGTFEVMDGQQRTLSICEYVAGKFDYHFRYFSNLSKEERSRILDYGLTVYFCEGGDDEKLEWFKTINIAGKELTDQELLNAVYAGPWTADVKRFFSKPSGPAYTLANRYLKGEAIRQDYMETALEWISSGDVKSYMAKHQHDTTAMTEWLYFKGVIDWVQALFPKYRREMKGLDWGGLYRLYGKGKYDPATMEREIQRLMSDDDVTRKGGIYEYLLSDGERESALSIRKFTDSQKRSAYERQGGKCADCGKHYEFEEMHGDHKTPWSRGGHTVPDNLQMLCRTCNLRKSSL